MIGSELLAKGVAGAGASVGRIIVETWIKPKLKRMAKDKKVQRMLEEYLFEDKFAEYLTRAADNRAYINTIVFDNQEKRLEELYIPLTIEGPNNASYKLTGSSISPVKHIKRLLLVDTAGMGKSTLLKWMFLESVKSNIGIPVFIELRKLTKENGILNEITREIDSLDEKLDQDFLFELIKRGDFIFFFDGLDEISPNNKDIVLEELLYFMHRAKENLFALSSRQDESLYCFPDFTQFNIKPLEEEEAYELLKKYSTNQLITDALINQIKDDITFKNIKEFLKNPMLVSLLFRAYEYKSKIPYKKHIFYRQVYDALYDKHDFSKGGLFNREKKSKLDIDDFHRTLRFIGYETVKLGKLEYDTDELLNYIRRAKIYYTGMNFKEADFLTDLYKAVPLFQKDGNYYKWVHKSIQEYFAAQFICTDTNNHQATILRQMVKENIYKYYNVLDLCFNIDYRTFKNTIIYDLLVNYIEYCDNTYKQIHGVEIDEIRSRQGLCYGIIHAFLGKDYSKMRTSNTSSEFEYDEYDEVRGEIMQKMNLKSGDVKGGSRISKNNAVRYQIYLISPLLLKLLSEKEESFITYPSYDLYFKLDFSITPNELVIISDNPLEEYNKPGLFEKVNHLLSTKHMPLLSYNESRKVVLEIEEDIKRCKQGFDLLNGL